MNFRRKWPWFCLAAAVLVCWTLWANTALKTTEYTIHSERIPEGFDGFRIAQISDLHNAQFGDSNSSLIGLLTRAEPDLILLTGDLIDSVRTDCAIALDFARQALQIAPVYYVSGNHEAWSGQYAALKQSLEDAGVTVLDNQTVSIHRDDASITLLGIADPAFSGSGSEITARNAISSLQLESDGYTVLLSHRPELFSVYAERKVDLVFSGHAHGGQFRLPLLGGLIAPDQGLLPKYDAGTFAENTTTMVVSRGLGNSIIPIRFNNRPELVVVTLRTGDS